MADKLSTLTPALRRDLHPARLWEPRPHARVSCHLCPRHCNIPVGGLGFCGVRYNQGGRLMTLNYGKSVPITEERIESEAVYHYAPGARILSLGNIGCMLKCDFCQNWQTSQARLVGDRDIVAYTPEQVVEYALRHDIRILSWTYNDPVVWHEFVIDTARLARQAGLKNLYKSAFAIGPQAINELLEVIDIFSISLKSLDPAYYRKFTRGEMQPVLDGIEQVYRARAGGGGPHLEISNLCLTGRNDTLTEARRVADWMLEHLDADIPLHYVRFHPDYLYTGVARTSIEFLEAARQQALAAGMRYVYLGNTPGTTSVDTRCPACGELAIQRSGEGLAQLHADGHCRQCGHPLSLHALALAAPAVAGTAGAVPVRTLHHKFRGPIAALHVEQSRETPIRYVFVDAAGAEIGDGHSACLRFLVSRPGARAVGLRLELAADVEVRVMEVFDRAHFPTATAAQSAAGSCDLPPALVQPR